MVKLLVTSAQLTEHLYELLSSLKSTFDITILIPGDSPLREKFLSAGFNIGALEGLLQLGGLHRSIVTQMFREYDAFLGYGILSLSPIFSVGNLYPGREKKRIVWYIGEDEEWIEKLKYVPQEADCALFNCDEVVIKSSTLLPLFGCITKWKIFRILTADKTTKEQADFFSPLLTPGN